MTPGSLLATSPAPPWQAFRGGPGSRAVPLRLGAWAVSTAITLAVLMMFSGTRPWRTVSPGAPPESRAVLLTLPSPTPAPRVPAPAPARAAVTPERRVAVPPPSEPTAAIRAPEAAAITPSAAEGQSASATPGPVPDAPAGAASAPLRLDRAVLREAARAARSEVGRMADTSGAPLGDRPVGRDERLAGDVARSVRRDCLPLSNPGGDLITPLLALAGKLTGRCN